MARQLRTKGLYIVVETRKEFKFKTPKGYPCAIVATKADSEEEAKKYIEQCLQIELKEAA